MLVNENIIKKLKESYKNRFNAIIFRLSGPDVLTQEEIDALVMHGLIDPQDLNHTLISDAYSISRLRGGVDYRNRDKVSLKYFRDKMKGFMPQLSPREKYAIEHVKRSAGNYITKLRDNMLADIEGSIRAYNYDERNKMLHEVVKPTIEEGIRGANVTISEVASRLRERTADTFRDWRRVAITELSNALNLGAADAIIERNHGQTPETIYVYKIVHLDSALCNFCRNFYLEPDGITPKVYKMSELIANGSNYGKKASDWKPTLGSVHPNERCEIVELPQGYGFEEGSNRATFVGKDFKWYERNGK